ncbi:MAG: hypothetical protein E7K75_05560 [Finegoldia magna]|uniref:V-type ATP synthase subunit E n=1 Tax=Finegoldia TaxID=150022 RepID=UPI0025DA460F|nr:V-type ATP synthase subunit E family protein [Finegoldia magna]MBS5776338.1 hypothetical protein [Finegoldia magna]MDU1832695.1 hypothetical protein [Finegoldia magna]MDU1878211.1 hypothetical protein [Finegoldia magna]MDU2575243.1 hypothetical protein [Finegoldia magna]MDU4571308.1 hypothetical protein [Finegoldia magna]
MILLEKKLDIFNKIIYTNKKQDYEKRLLDVKNSNQNELKNYEQKLIDEYNINLKKRTRKAEQKSIEKLRTAEQESRRELLVLKENVLQKLFDNVTKKILDFVKTDTYKEKLIKNIKENLSELDYKVVLLVLQNDYDYVTKNLSCEKVEEIKSIPNNYLGGFMIQDVEKTVNFDYTYLSKMKDCKHQMGEDIHNLMTGGDINE